MPSASRTISIDRPVEEVFAFFTTPSNDPKWRPHVKEINALGPPATGSRIHQVVQGPGGRGIPADIQVTAYEPPNRYAFKAIAGPVRPEGEFRMTAAGETTEVTLSLNADLGGLKKLALSRSVQKAMEGEVGGLDAAKRLLEGH
ncbi:hypothetical protein N865_20345 [Intrasporangium oryzae NRRL B-24470]|uniref:Polyketide cyclase n=1 Tax=Intrasporangium oryzae NRRL B-24470 TaxID=1386089 RepID=W9GB32_9MICO|nr:SRPBCC family protein [Intrasporangium oryzae]EWT02013.1 hypothetical protein N865_20345 [Intrasporangium oryzae NRRL B-24470]